MAEVSLVKLRPDLRAFTRWATRCRYLRTGTDEGYALHAALAGGMGQLAPRPFCLQEEGNDAVLYGYVAGPAERLHEAVALPPTTEEATFLRLAELEVRSMPIELPAGRSFGFSVRTRPIVRSKNEGAKGHHEVDAAPWAARRAEAEGEPVPSKEAAYASWLRDRLAAYNVTLLSARVLRMRRTKVLRRPATERGRAPRVIEGPDVTFDGTLSFEENADLGSLLTSGVGRHAAFGYGCLLLRPA